MYVDYNHRRVHKHSPSANARKDSVYEHASEGRISNEQEKIDDRLVARNWFFFVTTENLFLVLAAIIFIA